MTTFSFILPANPIPTDLGMTEETDLGTRAVSYALWQYLDLPRFTALLREICDTAQPMESVTYDVYVGMRLSTAVGVQLDMLGTIVGETRGQLVDAEFRQLIAARIVANKSNGKAGEIYDNMAIFGADTYRLFDLYPAAYYTEILGCVYPSTVFRILDYMHPAGVAYYFVYSTYDSTKTFMFSETYATAEYDADTGYGSSYSATTGGRYAGELT